VSGLGSYDQAELYRTQQGHAQGYKFTLFPESQEDMFAEGDDGGCISFFRNVFLTRFSTKTGLL